jgi:hypothetical protein
MAVQPHLERKCLIKAVVDLEKHLRHRFVMCLFVLDDMSIYPVLHANRMNLHDGCARANHLTEALLSRTLIFALIRNLK